MTDSLIVRRPRLILSILALSAFMAAPACAEKVKEPWLDTPAARAETAGIWREQLARFEVAPTAVQDACSTIPSLHRNFDSRYVAQSLRDCLDRHADQR